MFISQLLHEATGHIITLELKSGETYRGKLLDTEDNMNLQLKDIAMTSRDGRVTQLEQVYVRGSSIKFIIVPDMLKNAPMFKRFGPNANKTARGIGIGRGRATMQRVAQASTRGRSAAYGRQ